MLTPDELDSPEALRSLIAAVGLRLAERIIGASQLARITGDRFGGLPRTTFYWRQRKLRSWRDHNHRHRNGTTMLAHENVTC